MKADIAIATTSTGGTNSLGRIIRKLDEQPGKPVTVCMSHGLYQDNMVQRIVKDLQAINRLTGAHLPVRLLKEDYEGISTEQIHWQEFS